MTIGTNDVQGVTLKTNGVARHEITSAGAHTITATTHTVNAASGTTSVRTSTGEVVHTVKRTGNNAGIVMGVGNGGSFSTGTPFIVFSANSDTAGPGLSATGSTLNISAVNGNYAFSPGSNPLVFTNVSITQSVQYALAHGSLNSGLGVVNQNTDFFVAYYSPNANTNISWNAGSSTFNTVVATPRIATSSAHSGDICGFKYRPTEISTALATVQKAFTNEGQTSGWGVYVNTVKNYLQNTLMIGTTTDDTKSILNVASTTRYALPAPRMTTTQRDAIVSPAEGAEIYNLTVHKKQVFDGTVWQDCW
jgi:hypothetical protein